MLQQGKLAKEMAMGGNTTQKKFFSCVTQSTEIYTTILRGKNFSPIQKINHQWILSRNLIDEERVV